METADVYSQFKEKLERFIRSRVRHGTDADDILQDVFLKVHQSLPNLKQNEKLQSWLYTIARNAVTDHFRKKKASIAHETTEGPESPIEQKDLLECMWPFVSQLPEKYRVAIQYCDIEGHTQSQLAGREKISIPGAKSRLQRARAMLRELFTSCCHIETDRYGNVVEHIPKGQCACA